MTLANIFWEFTFVWDDMLQIWLWMYLSTQPHSVVYLGGTPPSKIMDDSPLYVGRLDCCLHFADEKTHVDLRHCEKWWGTQRRASLGPLGHPFPHLSVKLGFTWGIASTKESFLATGCIKFPLGTTLSLTSWWVKVQLPEFGASLKGGLSSRIPCKMGGAVVKIRLLFSVFLWPILFPPRVMGIDQEYFSVNLLHSNLCLVVCF